MSNKSQKDLIIDEARKQALEGAIGSESMEKIASFSGSRQQPYPTPFLNLSDMHIPQTTTEIMKWCKYFYTFDPIISGAINALATFPVSEIHLEPGEDSTAEEQQDDIALYNRVFHKTLDIYKLSIEIGIDYHLYGNCFVFGEMHENPNTGEKEWRRMTRLDPSRMIIDYNPATGEKKYKWQIPPKIKDIVLKKKPVEEYQKIPEMIRKAAINNQTVVLNPENIYHFSRATDSMGEANVWGTPIVANVLKLLMYRNTLRQAQEAIAKEHIVPLRIFYLEKTDSYNTHTNFNETANALAGHISKSVRDPNHKVVSPVPVNVLNVGGNGRGLLLAPEIEQVQGEILAGMNVPREFIFGGVSYSGSSISLKILENQFITYRLLLKDFYQNFVIKGMEKARGNWINDDDDKNLITIRMIELKMQDDVQQKQLIFQMNSSGKCSNDMLWKTMGIDAEKMQAQIEKEAVEAIRLKTETEKAEIQAQLELLPLQHQLQMQQMQMQMQMQQAQMQMQMQMQAQMGIPQEGEQPPDDKSNGKKKKGEKEEQATQQAMPQDAPQDEQMAINEQVDKIALQLVKMPPEERGTYMDQLPPSIQATVSKRIEEIGPNQGSQVDMRPMPTQRPPRRDSLK